MRTLKGVVAKGFGVASKYLKRVERLMLQRTGLPTMAPGTFNVAMKQDYIVKADALIVPTEYFTGETLKLQRCRVQGHRMIIMRPDSHERPAALAQTCST